VSADSGERIGKLKTRSVCLRTIQAVIVRGDAGHTGIPWDGKKSERDSIYANLDMTEADGYQSGFEVEF